MPAKKYRVDLTAEERDTLLSLIRSGKTAARQVTRARILLKADEGLSDEGQEKVSGTVFLATRQS